MNFKDLYKLRSPLLDNHGKVVNEVGIYLVVRDVSLISSNIEHL